MREPELVQLVQRLADAFRAMETPSQALIVDQHEHAKTLDSIAKALKAAYAVLQIHSLSDGLPCLCAACEELRAWLEPTVLAP